MKVIVICEFSGVVRDAFIRQGHDATSCDLLPSESKLGPHIIGDCLELDYSPYDLVIAHPPCTHLSSSGAKHFWYKGKQQAEAINFVRKIWKLPAKSIAIENPIGILSTQFKEYTQCIQPYEFGHPYTKSTCLWLKNLPKLKPTNIVVPSASYAHTETRNQQERSRTFKGVAEAMAAQWGQLPEYYNFLEVETAKLLAVRA